MLAILSEQAIWERLRGVSWVTAIYGGILGLAVALLYWESHKADRRLRALEARLSEKIPTPGP